ncbi:tetratricopeptide repeat-containing sulfotransferase family protein [Pseudomonas sp. LPB0260]|uniref:tetratricopeptide repeat-containing sulfotransferase family protein n=1 Tax=Pseudomonas sp. LPB0260 TaxID=2614442 RepID=UPI001C440B15|nr:tetratricopeptide repeat-containing sulfotransferase family protein [Pseudomonas sp. LPB0260]
MNTPTQNTPAPGAQQSLSIPQAMQLAFEHHGAGRLAEAEGLLRKILQVAPQHATALHLLGVIAQQAGNLELGVQLLQQAVQLAPGEAQFLSNLAEMCRRLGRLEEAVRHGEQAIALAPQSALAQSNLGIAYYDQGDLARAKACQQRALALNPRMPAALNNLGSILRDEKDKPGAIDCYRQVLAIAPDHAEAASNLGSVLCESEQPEEALKVLLPLVKARPNYAEAHSNLATAFLLQEQLDKAEFGFRRALALKPEYPEACIGLAKVLQEKRCLAEAEASALRGLQIAPDKAELHSVLGGILTESGYPEKAEAAYRQALSLDPKLITGYLGRGHLRMENGDMAGARADFEHALSLDEENLGARLALVQVDKVKEGDANMAALVASAQQLESLPEIKALPLHFALGKCYEDTREYDLAFQHYQQGCQLKRKRIDYSADATDRLNQNIRGFFSQENIDRLRGAGCSSELPIFVLGMPRSGTTLTETILASHSAVYGAGELHDILEIANHPRGQSAQPYPASLEGITQAELQIMGERYVAGLQKRAPGSARITDKMPANFQCLGLIHLMLPKAKIIHVKRNPVDTCLSNFTRLFNKSQYQSYDLVELGRYYRHYAALMEHWRAVLPADAFYEIQYEELVADQEGQARAMLDYCGLEWEEACLDFHKTERSIRTASVTQVRQPIYKTSVEKWRHYEQHLGPLLDVLGDLIER